MRMFNLNLTVLVICISSIFNVAASQLDGNEYNNLISQCILKNITREIFFTSQGSKKVTFEAHPRASSSQPNDAETIITWYNRSKDRYKPETPPTLMLSMEQRGQTFTIIQDSYKRSFRISDKYEIRRAWFHSCESVSILLADQNGKLTTQNYRVCHRSDLEDLTAEQRTLFVQAKDILQSGRTPVIRNLEDYHTYLSLPTDLQKAFKVHPEFLQKHVMQRKAFTLAALATILGGYMTIF
jgi:hypothetical protein